MYMLDTNILSYVMNHIADEIAERIAMHIAKDLCISSITYAELRYGIDRKADGKRKVELERSLTMFLSGMRVLYFDDMAAAEYGRVRSALEKRGTPIGLMDMLIAAHAKSRKCVVVTHNVREFSRVEGLLVEDWVS